MDWRWWHYAKEKGVKCAINPDAHYTNGLQDLWFGVAQALKGWRPRCHRPRMTEKKSIQRSLVPKLQLEMLLSAKFHFAPDLSSSYKVGEVPLRKIGAFPSATWERGEWV